MFAGRGAAQRRLSLGAFRWSPSSLRRHHRRARERSDRSHRSERRGQDHAVQRHHRTAATHRRHRGARRQGHHDHEAAPAGPPRDRPHVPAARDVRHAQRARQRPRRGGDAQGLVARKVQARRPRRRADRAHRAHVGREGTGRPSVHRHAATGRDGPGVGHQATGAAARRAVVRPQRVGDRPSSPSCSSSSPPPASPSCSSSTTWVS